MILDVRVSQQVWVVLGDSSEEGEVSKVDSTPDSGRRVNPEGVFKW